MIDYKSYGGRSFEEISVNDQRIFSKSITEADVVWFAGLTGDVNPLHVDSQFARQTPFRQRVVHGAFTAGLVSAALTHLTGPGYVYLSQQHRFLNPVFIGDTIRAVATVKEKREDKKILVVETKCLNQDDKVVLVGEAYLMEIKYLAKRNE